MQSTTKMKLSCHDCLDRDLSIMKTRQDNSMIDRTGAIYAKNNTELSRPIRSGAGCDKNQVGKLRDLFYKCSLRKK